MPYYITDECIDCGACLGVCPVSAILEERLPIVEPYLSIINALRDLKYNGQVLDLGPFKIYLTSNTVSVSP